MREEIDTIRAEEAATRQKEESVTIIDLRRQIKQWEVRFNFLAERLYLSDLENRALMVEIGTRQDVIDVRDERHTIVVEAKRRLEIEITEIRKLIEEYKITIAKHEKTIKVQESKIIELTQIVEYHEKHCIVEIERL